METKLLHAATQWLNEHKDHVRTLSNNSNSAIKPTGEDYNNPALWKGCHWNWFLIETQITLIEHEISFSDRVKHFFKIFF